MCDQPGRRTTAAPAPAPSHAVSACLAVLQDLVDCYGGDTHRLLTDLADVIGASIAYVDRPTVEAQLERRLSDAQWTAVTQQFTATAFDDHVGDAGNLRTDWIEDVLARAGVPGRGREPLSGGGPLPVGQGPLEVGRYRPAVHGHGLRRSRRRCRQPPHRVDRGRPC